MHLKLKEDPREWLKFTAVMAVMLGVVGGLLRWRHTITTPVLAVWIALLSIVLAACWRRPRAFRSFYRTGMTISFHVGQFMGKVMLAIFFLLVLTPTGLLLRCLGKDLLQLKRPPQATSYWRPAKTSHHFDRQF